jgi:hypothetical protein
MPSTCEHCRQSFASRDVLHRHLGKADECRNAEQVGFAARAKQLEDVNVEMERGMSSSEDSSIESDGNLDPDVNMLPLDDFEVDVPDEPQPPPNPSTSRRSPSIEDVPDEGDTLPLPPQATSRYTERYAAGKAGKKLEYVRTRFEEQRAKQQQQGTDRWGRFGDRESFDMLKWVVDSVGKGKADEFLKQPWVSCSASLLCLLRC